MLSPAPKIASNEGVRDTLSQALGDMLLAAKEEHGEIVLTVQRDAIVEALRSLRDEHDYQQLMEIAGVDYPARAERFEVVYCLLSLTRNHRIIVKCCTDEATPVPTVTGLWPVAGWLEREVFDLYGVVFAGHPDLRRILTDYGFQGHPFRKDFPLTGYVELRYSEEDKRVVYEPVELAQDLRTFDFMSPWEGADYVLPGDEKAVPVPPAPAAQPTPAPAPAAHAKVEAEPRTGGPAPTNTPKTTDAPHQTGAGEPANAEAVKQVAPSAEASSQMAGQGQGQPVPKSVDQPAPGAPDPTERRPDRAPREKGGEGGTGPAPEGS
ncbi:MAG: NADH-quinone oxidoreductase subunit C [Novosphingobium sp.]